MTLEAAIYTLLNGNATVGGLVGTRVYPVIAPANVTRPFVVYARTGSDAADLSGRDAMELGRVQIDCYADDVDGAAVLGRAVSQAIEDASGAARGYVSSEFDSFDEGTHLYYRTLDASFYFPAN